MDYYSEEDTKANILEPIIQAKWPMDHITREYSYTDGRIKVVGQTAHRDKGSRKRVDYVLWEDRAAQKILAIIEAESNQYEDSKGFAQARDYAEDLDVPFVFASSGRHMWNFKNRLTQEEGTILLDKLPSFKELMALQGSVPEETREPYYVATGESPREPRYYQRNAINAAVDSIVAGQRKNLLVMATGTGKTYTAFQIIYRLLNAGVKKHVLYLADRDVLISQTMNEDFAPFVEKGIITRVGEGKEKVETAYQIHMALYQQLSSNEVYKQFKPGFFDLIIIDEAHRGGGNTQSSWHDILDYFDTENTAMLAMTATPKNQDGNDTVAYFGEPIYNYTLKQGIDDGFLAPYKVVRVMLDKDWQGFESKDGDVDDLNRSMDKRAYGQADFDRKIILGQRTEAVAKYVTDYMRDTGQSMAKTIVFTVDEEHAERLRGAFANLNKDKMAENEHYVVRITSSDKIGKSELDNFQDVNTPYPVIATTSQMLRTGVNAKTVKLIILDSPLNSMSEFKQIIGRGTRIDERHGKSFFTIIDFRNVTRLFADPAFDGEPEEVVTTGGNGGVQGGGPGPEGLIEPPKPKYVKNGVPVSVQGSVVQIRDANGNLVTESVDVYTKNSMLETFPDMDSFVGSWKSSEKKTEMLETLQEKGIYLDLVRHEHPEYAEYDDFDVLVSLVYDAKPLTKSERAKNALASDILQDYKGPAREVLELLIQKYVADGIDDLENPKVLKTPDFEKYGTPVKIAYLFGGSPAYKQVTKKLANQIYEG